METGSFTGRPANAKILGQKGEASVQEPEREAQMGRAPEGSGELSKCQNMQNLVGNRKLIGFAS